MYLDYKATIWFRIPIESEDDLEKIKKKMESGELPSELYNDPDLKIGQCEPLYDTEEFISPNENDGQSTIEIFNDPVNTFSPTNLVWDNSYESEIKRKEQHE